MKKPIFNKTARLFILNRIFEQFQQILQWGIIYPINTANSLNEAESLIQLLEIDDCGSIGGFDNSNPVEVITPFHPYNRFLALLKKYDTKSRNVKSICGLSVAKATKAFKDFGDIWGKI